MTEQGVILAICLYDLKKEVDRNFSYSKGSLEYSNVTFPIPGGLLGCLLLGCHSKPSSSVD